MRVSDDLRRCVVFIGFKDDTPDGSGIKCAGTAFLLNYKTFRYLVTVKHIAVAIGDTPFLIRMNGLDQKEAGNIHVDGPVDGSKWYCHDDQDVDLAVMPFHFDLRKVGFDFLNISETMVADATRIAEQQIGCGDMCYTVGLFRLLAGKKRNLPVIHTGNIALMPSDERIPVRDWEAPSTRKRRHVEGYLVQSQSLQGLSGSPVFVRPAVDVDFDPVVEKTIVKLPRPDLYLLGVWQGAWDAPADEVLAADRGRDLRVPVGMGVVVPAAKLIELLDTPKLERLRDEAMRKREAADAAQLDEGGRNSDR